MSYFQRCPLASAAALASYFAVHIFAGVLHHHVAENQPGNSPTAASENSQLQMTGPHENDEAENCAVCSVLHQAQILPTAFQIEAVALFSSQELSAAAMVRPHPLEKATFTRGPPLF